MLTKVEVIRHGGLGGTICHQVVAVKANATTAPLFLIITKCHVDEESVGTSFLLVCKL